MSLCMHVHRLSSCCSLALVVDRLQGLSEIFEVHVIEIIVVHLVAVTILHDNIQSLLYILRKKTIYYVYTVSDSHTTSGACGLCKATSHVVRLRPVLGCATDRRHHLDTGSERSLATLWSRLTLSVPERVQVNMRQRSHLHDHIQPTHVAHAIM